MACRNLGYRPGWLVLGDRFWAWALILTCWSISARADRVGNRGSMRHYAKRRGSGSEQPVAFPRCQENGGSYTMSDDELKAELERLRSENAALKRGASSGIA